jgi:hypothetical protein
MNIAELLFGFIVLLFGRKLFWVFVGVMGFLVGFDLARLYLIEHTPALIYVVAIVFGILGILVALFLQRIAFGIAGFLAGGYAITTLFIRFGWQYVASYELVFLTGGIVGALAVILLTDWGLIILSSLVGAVTISNTLLPDPRWTMLMVIALTAIGIYIQRLFLTKQYPASFK